MIRCRCGGSFIEEEAAPFDAPGIRRGDDTHESLRGAAFLRHYPGGVPVVLCDAIGPLIDEFPLPDE